MTFREFWQKATTRRLGQVASPQDSQDLRHGLAAVSDENHALQAEMGNVRQLVVQTGDEGSRKLDELQQHVVQASDEGARKLAELQQHVEHAVAEQEREQHLIQGLQGVLQDAKARQDKAESRVGELELELRQEHVMQLGLIHQIEGRERALELRTGRAVWVASAALLLVAISSAAMIWNVHNNNRRLGDLGGDIQDTKLPMAQPPAHNLNAPPVEEYDLPPAGMAQPPEMIPETYQSQAEPDEVIDLLPVPSVISTAGSANQDRKYEKREDAQLFFDDIAQQPGVISLPSGLHYKNISQGNGRMPSMSDRVLVDYRAFLLDGTEFDSSYQKQGDSIYALDEVLPVMKEALLLMEEGAQLELYIPHHLTSKAGTRKRGKHRFEPQVYILELKSIVDADEPGQDQ